MSEASVLVVDDDMALREALRETLVDAGFRVTIADNGATALERLASQEIGLVVTDARMERMDGYTLLREVRQRHPRVPILLMTAYGTVQNAVEAMRYGASDFLVKPFAADLFVSKVTNFIASPLLMDDGIIATDARMRELIELATRVASSDATVMITGDSGTGKEVLARYIHRRSRRVSQPFVAVNCAAIPENMLEAMLFGYEKGAFTGAVQSSQGKFEQAQGGTLLLDEISEMNLALQAKLLRVLQEREVERLGGRRLIPLDVRVLCTTNRMLREEVAAGRFREDLFYRLNVFPLHLPPLRERPGDVAPLTNHLLARHVLREGRPVPRLSALAHQALLTHLWPGNVRELDNLIQRALILQPGNEIGVSDLRFESGTSTSDPEATFSEAAVDTLGQDLKSREQCLIIEALRAESGSRKHTAERLGISARTLRYKIARMRASGIQIPG